jgi:hypothetical protein
MSHVWQVSGMLCKSSPYQTSKDIGSQLADYMEAKRAVLEGGKYDEKRRWWPSKASSRFT